MLHVFMMPEVDGSLTIQVAAEWLISTVIFSKIFASLMHYGKGKGKVATESIVLRK